MARLRRKAAVAAAVAALIGAAAAATSCTSAGTQVSIVPTPTARCLVMYTPGWSNLGMRTIDGSGAPLTFSGLSGNVGHVEFYRDSNCAPDAFLDAAECAAGAAAPSVPQPTSPATPRPTAGAPPQPPTTDAPPRPPVTSPPLTSVGCSSSGSQVSIVPTATARCVAMYSSTWSYLGLRSLDGSGALLTVTGLPSSVTYVEFYRGSDCAPDAFLSHIQCTSGAAAPAPPQPTSGATPRPTSGAPPAPTVPANPPTNQPTNRPTNPPAAPPSTPGYTGGPPADQYRAMYVWEVSQCLFNGVTPTGYPRACLGATSYLDFQDKLLANLTSPHRMYAPINRIYLEVDMNVVRNQPDMLRAFIGKASAAGIAVEHLSGDARWVLTAAATNAPIQMCRDLAAFNRATTNPAQRLAGVHMDIEPHVMDGWRTNTGAGRDNYNDLWQANLVAIFRACQSAVADANLLVAWDTGHDYYHYVTDTWDELLANPFVDYLTIMNYFDNEPEFLFGRDGIGGVVNILANLNGRVPAVFAAETIMPPFAPSSDSFWQEGTLPLENMLGRVGRQFHNSRGFLGLATHHYGSYVLLPKDGAK